MTAFLFISPFSLLMMITSNLPSSPKSKNATCSTSVISLITCTFVLCSSYLNTRWPLYSSFLYSPVLLSPSSSNTPRMSGKLSLLMSPKYSTVSSAMREGSDSYCMVSRENGKSLFCTHISSILVTLLYSTFILFSLSSLITTTMSTVPLPSMSTNR